MQNLFTFDKTIYTGYCTVFVERINSSATVSPCGTTDALKFRPAMCFWHDTGLLLLLCVANAAIRAEFWFMWLLHETASWNALQSWKQHWHTVWLWEEHCNYHAGGSTYRSFSFQNVCTLVVFRALVMFCGHSASQIWAHEATDYAPFYLTEASSFKSRPFYIVKQTTCTDPCTFNDPWVKPAFKQ